MIKLHRHWRGAVQCIGGPSSCASLGLVANTNPGAARGLHRSHGCKDSKRAHMRIFDRLRRAARCYHDYEMFLCIVWGSVDVLRESVLQKYEHDHDCAHGYIRKLGLPLQVAYGTY